MDRPPYACLLGPWAHVHIQSIDRPFMVGTFTLTTISLMARLSYACASHKPSPGVSPQAPPPIWVLTRFTTTLVPFLWFNVSSRLVSDADGGSMTLRYLWQVGPCGLLESYNHISYCLFLTRVECKRSSGSGEVGVLDPSSKSTRCFKLYLPKITDSLSQVSVLYCTNGILD